jgi:hypothetical protein
MLRIPGGDDLIENFLAAPGNVNFGTCRAEATSDHEPDTGSAACDERYTTGQVI